MDTELKPQGRKITKTRVPDHQDCAICHPNLKPAGRSREKLKERREIMDELPKMSQVFESRFHGQVYTIDGAGYDVPKLTYWCQDNVPVEDIPLAELTMSKSDEKHGSKEFEKHAADLEQDPEEVPPIVVVARDDGTLQIADGNHRAWNAASTGQETIRGHVVAQGQLPDEALVEPKKEKK